MRRIYRSAPELVGGLFTETTGKDITSCDVEVGLAPSTTTGPPTTWRAPTTKTNPTNSTAQVALLVDSDTPPGVYAFWIRVVDEPETLVRQAESETGDELIHVI